LNKEISLDANNPKGYRLLGDLYNYLEQPEKAVPLFKKALSLYGEYEEAMSGLGNALVKLKDYEAAAVYLQHALKMNDSPANNHNIGVLLFHAGHLEQCTSYLLRAHSLDEKNVSYIMSYGRVLYRMGKTREAALAYYKGMLIEPDNNFMAGQLTSILKEMKIKGFDAQAKEIMVFLLSQPNIQHIDLSGVWVRTLLFDPDLLAFREHFKHKNYADFKEHVEWEQCAETLSQEFFTNGLRLLLNLSSGFESFLVNIRRSLLERAVSGDDQGMEKQWCVFAAALAENCFLNEYIFAYSDEEKQQVNALHERLKAMGPKDDNAALYVAILGCYEPLFTQGEEVIALSQKLTKKAHMASLVKLQIEEPLIEQDIKKDLPIIGEITDIVSQKVQEQYEEHPYPRWRYISIDRDKHGSVLQQYPYDILIAGCGTGQQILQDKRMYPNANILAVDLSRSSIAYAKRKVEELGVTGVEFAHADILQLGALDKKFDFVMCSGVLHHMEDPEAGLAVLKSLLKPEGLMNIGLYSEYAREKVVAYRAMVKEKGWPSSVEGIRALRHYVDRLDNDDPMKVIAMWRDFFTTSMCRDLLFHVQEHRYTMLQLKDMYGRFGLSFYDFSHMTAETMNKFRAKYPDAEDFCDFDKWEEFELENKDAFLGMYQMWLCNTEHEDAVRKKAHVINQYQK
jgi:ubiquinone/menaquinone biosynthesis C-methylase UbiE